MPAGISGDENLTPMVQFMLHKSATADRSATALEALYQITKEPGVTDHQLAEAACEISAWWRSVTRHQYPLSEDDPGYVPGLVSEV